MDPHTQTQLTLRVLALAQLCFMQLLGVVQQTNKQTCTPTLTEQSHEAVANRQDDGTAALLLLLLPCVVADVLLLLLSCRMVDTASSCAAQEPTTRPAVAAYDSTRPLCAPASSSGSDAMLSGTCTAAASNPAAGDSALLPLPAPDAPAPTGSRERHSKSVVSSFMERCVASCALSSTRSSPLCPATNRALPPSGDAATAVRGSDCSLIDLRTNSLSGRLLGHCLLLLTLLLLLLLAPCTCATVLLLLMLAAAAFERVAAAAAEVVP